MLRLASPASAAGSFPSRSPVRRLAPLTAPAAVCSAPVKRSSALIILLLLVAVLTIGLVPLAAAQEGGVIEPAVVISDDAGDTEDPAWTFRYLVPTVLATSAVVLGLTVLLYGVRLRGRYRVVR